jgi:protein TonB
MRKPKPPRINTNLTRFIIFLAVGILHLILIFFFVIKVDAAMAVPEQPAAVMKLTDIQEEAPPPPPPPAPPEPEEPMQNTVEAIAETMIETDEEPKQIVTTAVIIPQRMATVEEEYLPMHKISVPPVFSENEIRNRLVYPAIPLRAGMEGMVYLELFVDRRGEVRQITVLRETPENRGFGEAAVNAFRGMQGTPAQANGAAVAVRYRYPVRFAIRG